MNKKISKKRADFKTPREKELRKERAHLFPRHFRRIVTGQKKTGRKLAQDLRDKSRNEKCSTQHKAGFREENDTFNKKTRTHTQRKLKSSADHLLQGAIK